MNGRWSRLHAAVDGRLHMAGLPGTTGAGLARNQRYATTKPAAVLSAAHPADVARAVRWAGEESVPLHIRGGGHSYAGYSTGPGLVLDLAALRDIRFDSGSGLVTVGGGTPMKDLYRALQPYGVTFPLGNSPTVGIGGLTLGGGVTTISRAYGLTCDALVSTEVTLADGRQVTASATEHPDLFWACRGGGGGNFGVNTSFTFRTRTAPAGSTCLIRWDWEAASRILTEMQHILLTGPDRFSARIGIERAGNGGRPSVTVVGHHLGPVAELQELLAPATAAARPDRVDLADRDFWQAATYLHHTSAGGAFAVRTRCSPTALGEDALACLVRAVEKWPGSGNPDGGGAALFAWGGAISEVPAAETAFAHRDTRFLLSLDTSWSPHDSAQVVGANLDWLNAVYDMTADFVPDGAYVNFTDPDLTDWQRSYYGANAARLAAVKRRYDPGRLFTFPQAL